MCALPVDPFVVTNALFSGLTLIVAKLVTQITGFTAATDTITKTAHGYSVGSTIAFVSGTGFTGLSAGTTYYVIEAPSSSTFKVSATSGGSAITVGTSTVGIFRNVHVFGSKLLTSKINQEEKALERPDSGGVLREVRNVLTKQVESFTFEIDDVKRLPSIFAGGLAGRILADVTLYCPDPDDVATFVALKSEEFRGTITRDGDVGIGNSEFSKGTFNIKSNKNGVIIFTPDATA